MNTALATTSHGLMAPDDFEHLQRVARMLAASQYFVKGVDMNMATAQIGVKIMAGQEMGIGPFASAQNIHVINGNPSVSAHMIASAIKEHPHYDYRIVEWDTEKCTIDFIEDGIVTGQYTYSVQDAKLASILDKDVWKKYRKAMLFARCISGGYRGYCPNALGRSRVYVYEEMGARVDESGSVVVVDGSLVMDEDITQTKIEPEKQARIDKLSRAGKKTAKQIEQTVDDDVIEVDAKEVDGESTEEELTEEESTEEESTGSLAPKTVDDEVDFRAEEEAEDKAVDEFTPYAYILDNDDYEISEDLRAFLGKYKDLHATSGRKMNSRGYDHLCNELISREIIDEDQLTPFFQMLTQTALESAEEAGALIGNPLVKDFADAKQLKLIEQVGNLVQQMQDDLT